MNKDINYAHYCLRNIARTDLRTTQQMTTALK